MHSDYRVFTYWENPEGQTMPAYIGTCLNSINSVCKDFSVTIITPDNVELYLKRAELNPNWKHLQSIAHRADCVRVAIMNKYGGLWIDADTVMLESPKEIFKKLDKTDLLYMKWDDGRVLNGYFLCKPGCPIMAEWVGKINMKLKHIDKSFVWTSFGEAILTPLIRKYRDDITEIPRQTFLPINIDKLSHIFFESIPFNVFKTPDTVAVGLSHSFFKDHYPEFLKDPTGDKMIHKLLEEAV